MEIIKQLEQYKYNLENIYYFDNQWCINGYIDKSPLELKPNEELTYEDLSKRIKVFVKHESLYECIKLFINSINV